MNLNFKQTLALFILFWLFVGVANSQIIVNVEFRIGEDELGNELIENTKTADQEYSFDSEFVYCKAFGMVDKYPILETEKNVGNVTLYTTNGRYVFFRRLNKYSMAWYPEIGSTRLILFRYVKSKEY